jgi:hypothetical protein
MKSIKNKDDLKMKFMYLKREYMDIAYKLFDKDKELAKDIYLLTILLEEYLEEALK